MGFREGARGKVGAKLFTLIRIDVYSYLLEGGGGGRENVLGCTQFNTIGGDSMTASTTMTIRVRPDVKEKLDRIASDTQRSKSFLAGEAVAAYVERELEIIDGIKRGMADVAAGRVVPHEQVMAEARQIIADAKRKKAS